MLVYKEEKAKGAEAVKKKKNRGRRRHWRLSPSLLLS